MSVFDPDKFMTQTADAGSTSFEPIPEKEYTAMVDDAVTRVTNNGGVLLDVTFLLNDADVAKQLGRDKLTVRTGIFLDINAANQTLDLSKGKNIKLNRLRDALGQNKPGWSPVQLKGAGPLKVMVSQRRDKDATDVIYNDVKAFGKMK